MAAPLIGLAFYVSARIAADERESTRAALLIDARSLAAAVDDTISDSIAVGKTLAQSKALSDADWPEFWRQAKAALGSDPESWVGVVDAGGQVLVNTSVPLGTPLPRRPLYAHEKEAFATGKPQVSNVVFGYVVKHPVLLAAVPVFRNGAPLYLVNVVFDPQRFQERLRGLRQSAAWVTAIVDRAGNYVARYPDEGVKAGEPAGVELRRAITERPEGVWVHQSRKGYPVTDAYADTDFGWTVSVAIRQSVLEAPQRRTQWLLLAASAGCIGLGVLLAWLVGRRLHNSAAVLHGAAKEIESEQPVRAVPTGVREYDEAVAAFAAASDALHARAQERDRAVAVLRRREADLEAVVNRTPFMLVRCGRDLRYRFASNAFADLVGRKPEDISGRPMVEVIGAKAFNQILPTITRVLKGERAVGEEKILREGAEARYLHVVATPETDASGEVIGWVGSMLDITEQKLAERERSRAEATLARKADEQAALYEFANTIYRTDSVSAGYQAGLVAILRALHCDRASVLRSDENGVMRPVAWRGLSDRNRATIDGYSPWPADANHPTAVCIADIDEAELPELIKDSLREEGIRALSFIPMTSPNGRLAGRVTTYHETPHPCTSDGLELALNLARRLRFAIERIEAEQARQAAEKELRGLKEKLETEVAERTLERDRIWNVSEDLLGVANFQGYITSINPAWTRLLGWSEAEIKSMHVSELRHPEDAAATIAARIRLAQGESPVRIENRFRHKDGTWRWIHWTMTAKNDSIYVSGRHVTLEKEAAAALQLAQTRSAHAQKMEALGALTGGVAHDFNNLLMIISGHAQSLKRRLSELKDKRALEAIQIAATRGESLTRQLLAFSRGMPLNPTVISLAETVRAIREVLAGPLRKNVELSIDVPQATWPVRVDKSELELALLNLTVNARDAMPGGGRLSITAQNVHLNADDTPGGLTGDFVALSVADTGSGIPADVVSRVFEPFFTTKSADKGTGLGLSQVYGFARRSGGTAAVKSALQHGTTVTLYLPRSDAAITQPLHEDAALYAAPTGSTVLVVEDNADVRAVTISLLEQLGYRTVAVEHADAALEALGQSPAINVVFSDVVLPGQIDGLLLARTVKARHPQIPIVLTTGYTRVFDSEPEFPVLRKPYQISALARIIREALDAAKTGKTALAS